MRHLNCFPNTKKEEETKTRSTIQVGANGDFQEEFTIGKRECCCCKVALLVLILALPAKIYEVLECVSKTKKKHAVSSKFWLLYDVTLCQVDQIGEKKQAD